MENFKIFHKDINNDLTKMSSYLQGLYGQMKMIYNIDKDDSFLESNSLSTIKWREYNVFQFNNIQIYDLLIAVKELAGEVFDYYHIDPKKERYMVQGWFNINHHKTGKLDWHKHVSEEQDTSKMFHGYYGVNIDDSSTFYKTEDKIFENKNKNNRLILSNSRYAHAMGDWNWEGPRISVAYDLLPLSVILEQDLDHQHWFPLTY
jgi:hypothetical protein